VPAAPAIPSPTRPAPAHRRRTPRAAAAAVALGLLAACTGGATDDASPSPSTTPAVLRSAVALPDAPVTVVPDASAGETALAVSRALFTQAPVAVLVAGGDRTLLGPAATAAVALGAPLLVAGVAGTAAEVERLGSTEVVVVGDADLDGLPADVRTHAVDGAAPDALADLGVDVGDRQDVAPADLTASVAALTRPATPLLVLDDPDAPAPAATATDDPSDAASADPGTTAGLGAEGTTVEAPAEVEHAALLVDSVTGAAAATVAAATARAAGVPVVDVPGGDPRATSATVQALTGVSTVLAVGSTFGAAELLGPRVASAATGVELPGGGQLVFPAAGSAPGLHAKRYVALYGTPGTPALGVLGEQDVPATIARAQQTAAPYDAMTDDTVVPTLEIIATVASAAPEPDGSYSRGRSVDELRPLVEAAAEAGQAVVIDLQPGRTDFLTQAQRYADLLAYPHVGLALDPEWRLQPDQVHLRQIGSVGVDEVNATAAWLAQFTRERRLPQKMFLLHQFSLRMIAERERLDTSHDELAVIIHADGQGSQPAKAGTWAALRQGAPPVHWGWKNFYDEDTPMLDPAQTWQVQPVPDLVTYQ
jgi:hypothetical protein